MNRLFFIFDIWGQSTQFRNYPNQSKINLVIFISHIIFALLATTLTVLYIIRPDDDEIARLNDYLKSSVLICVNWLSLIELYSKQDLQKTFWHDVFSIDQHFCSHKQYTLTSYLNKIIIYFICVTVNYSLALYTLIYNSGTKFVPFWCSYAFMLIFFKIRSFYHIFYLEFIKNELKIIDHEVNEMFNDCSCTQFNCMNRRKRFAAKFYRNRFNWIRQYYGLVYNLSCTVNTMFGWSNIVVILFTFHLILIEINWFYWKLLNKFEINITSNFAT